MYVNVYDARTANTNKLAAPILCLVPSCLFIPPQVVDVAKAIINAVRDPDANGKTYALVG